MDDSSFKDRVRVMVVDSTHKRKGGGREARNKTEYGPSGCDNENRESELVASHVFGQKGRLLG